MRILKNPKANNGWTPLHEAAENGHFSVCQLIVNNTKDLKPLNKGGKTPFDLAKEEGHEKIWNLFNSALKNQNEASK